MRFLTILLFIYLGWQVFKWIAKWAIRYWIRKNGGKAFTFNGNFGQQPSYHRPEGEIRVESFGNPESTMPKIKPGEGDYVDFEEVK